MNYKKEQAHNSLCLLLLGLLAAALLILCPKLSGQSGGNGYIRLQNHAFPKNLLVYRRKMRA